VRPEERSGREHDNTFDGFNRQKIFDNEEDWWDKRREQHDVDRD
jgi:hypothetical protein